MIDCSKVPMQDKGCHFIAGFSITLIVGFIAYLIGFDNPQAYGLIAGAIAGVVKELYDEYLYRKGEHPVGFDFFDMFATFLGSFFGGLFVVLFT